MPDHNSELSIGPGGRIMGNIIASMENLGNLDTVVVNNNRITIKPDTLVIRENGIIRPVSFTEISNLEGMSPEGLITTHNSNRYLYSPFHYVWDASGTNFDCRGYYLDNPVIESRSFIEENDTVGLEVRTGSYQIVRNEDGYVLRVITKSGDLFKALNDSQITVQ